MGNGNLLAYAERLASATEALEKVLGRIEASQKELHTKVDWIIAAIEEGEKSTGVPSPDGEGCGSPVNAEEEIGKRLADVERENAELRAQAGRLARKTLSPLVSGLLSKGGVEESTTSVEASALEKALATLSLEQRITVKAELARAGMIA